MSLEVTWLVRLFWLGKMSDDSNLETESWGETSSTNDVVHTKLTVCSHCLGLLYGGAKHGGFQTYTTCRESVTATIPDELTFAEAVVLPLALSTAMTGLFEQLQLKLPSIQESTPHGTVLIWGGSSSVGSTAIQLAVAAGYKVITTASPHNFAYVKSLGASEAIDHSADDAEAQIIRAFSKDTVAGVFDCIGEENTTKTCAAILSHFGGGVVPTVLWPPTGLPENVKAILGWFVHLAKSCADPKMQSMQRTQAWCQAMLALKFGKSTSLWPCPRGDYRHAQKPRFLPAVLMLSKELWTCIERVYRHKRLS